MMTNQHKWDTKEYQRIKATTCRGDDITVVFEDGTVVTVRADRLLPPHQGAPDWSQLKTERFSLTVPTTTGEADIAWSTIRALTDKEFSAHLAAAANRQAQFIGQRIRELRESRGLTSKDLAERAGITPQSMSRIELGRHDVTFSTLRSILGAMNYKLKDLSAPPTEEAEIDAAPYDPPSPAQAPQRAGSPRALSGRR